MAKPSGHWARLVFYGWGSLTCEVTDPSGQGLRRGRAFKESATKGSERNAGAMPRARFLTDRGFEEASAASGSFQCSLVAQAAL